MADLTRDEVLKQYEQVGKKYNFPEVLKEEQLEGLLSILGGKDTLCVLPTGYGKSLIYCLVPLLLDEMESGLQHTIVVVSPLKSLIKDQVARFSGRGMKVQGLHADTTDEERRAIFHGDFSVVFASPETLLKEIDKIADNVYPGKVCCLAVDEAHSIIDWTTFRPIFSYLGEAKATVASRVPWALFTATCDRQLKSALLTALGITNVALVWAAPDRPNIHLDISTKGGMTLENAFEGLADDLIKKKENLPKTIVYCRSKDHIGQLYMYLVMKLKDAIYYQGQRGVRNRMVEQFSSSYSGVDEARIVERVTSNDPKLRVIITSIALGMGIDMKSVEVIYHWGCPDNVLSYWQEVGRAGRSGEQSHAVLFATPVSLMNTQESMKKLIESVKSGMCIRKAVLQALSLTQSKEILQPAACCSNCSS